MIFVMSVANRDFEMSSRSISISGPGHYFVAFALISENVHWLLGSDVV